MRGSRCWGQTWRFCWSMSQSNTADSEKEGRSGGRGARSGGGSAAKGDEGRPLPGLDLATPAGCERVPHHARRAGAHPAGHAAGARGVQCRVR